MRLNLLWKAILQDGGQIDEGSMPYQHLVTHGFHLKQFQLINYGFRTDARAPAPDPVLTLHLSREHKVFYRARTAIEVSLGLGPGKVARGRTIIVGWQETRPKTGKDETKCAVHSQCIVLVHEQNGHIEIMDRFPRDQGIQLHPWEIEMGLVQEHLQ